MKSRRSKIIATGVVFLFLLTIFAAGFSNSISSLQNQLDTVKSDYSELQGNFISVNSDRDDLQEKYSDSVAKLESAKSELAKYKDQQLQIEELTRQLSDLQSQYDLLKAENDSLKSQMSSQQASASTSGAGTTNIPDNSSGGLVWLSATGSKYHSIPDCGPMNPNNARQVSQASAESGGFGRCSKCW